MRERGSWLNIFGLSVRGDEADKVTEIRNDAARCESQLHTEKSSRELSRDKICREVFFAQELSFTMNTNKGQIKQMTNFILQEAHEKANEIMIKTEHDVSNCALQNTLQNDYKMMKPDH